MALLFILGFALGGLIGLWAIRRRPQAKYLLHNEYWVYLPGEAMPPQDETMTRLVESGGVNAKEALLFSDVRLHLALLLRAKNRHVFRPDLLEPHVDATPEQLAVLDASRSLVKVRFLSEQPVDDRRHLAFLPRLAATVSRLGGGTLVYDPIGERLLDAASLGEGDPGPHVRWVPEPTGGHVRTHGMRKVGLPEIRTASILADERWIVSQVVGEVAGQAWRSGALPASVVVEAFVDRFRVDLALGKDDVASARVHRIQAA